MKEDTRRVEDKDYRIRHEDMAGREKERSQNSGKIRTTRMGRKETRKEKQRRRTREAQKKERKFRSALGDIATGILFIGRGLMVIGLLTLSIFFVIIDWFEVDVSWIMPAAGGASLALGLIIEGFLRIVSNQRRKSSKDTTQPFEQHKPIPIQLEPYSSSPTISKSVNESTEVVRDQIPTTVPSTQVQPEITHEDVTSTAKPKIKMLSEVARADFGETCMICTSQILKGEKYMRCHGCSKMAHLDHMNEWLQVKPICPECGTKLK